MSATKSLILCALLLSLPACRTEWAIRRSEGRPADRLPSLLMPRPSVSCEGGDGTSIEQAVVIVGAPSAELGSKAERKWVEDNHPGFAMTKQVLLQQEERSFDVLHLQTRSGERRTVYFDITDFFDKDQVGRWSFEARSGEQFEGNIGAFDLPVQKHRPWLRMIGERSGRLTYQIEEYLNSSLVVSVNVRNGEFDGIWTRWASGEWTNGGWTETRAMYRQGRPHGVSTTWSTNGIKLSEWRFPDGKCKSWYENGKLESVRHFKDGEYHGSFVTWYEDGTKRENLFRMGQAHGTSRGWHANGNMKWEAKYNMGELVAAPKEWDTSGNLTPKCKRETPIIERLFEVGLSFNRLKFLDDSHCFLHLGDSGIHDLSLLVGLPITDLALADCPVSDLSPLTNMSSLVRLNLHSTQVRDITPLKGMPLRGLTLAGTLVTDLRAVGGMPLEHFVFNAERITNGMSELRSIRTLKRINSRPASEFWQRYDADRKK